MRVPSPSDRIYAGARQSTMNLRHAFNNCASARKYTRIEHSIAHIMRSITRLRTY